MKIEIGKIYNGRKVFQIAEGINAHGNKDSMIFYRYEGESEEEPLLVCSISTFKKHANKFGF